VEFRRGIFVPPLCSLAEATLLTNPIRVVDYYPSTGGAHSMPRGMMGQYAFAVLWGSVIDSVGPHACSLAASALFLFSWSAFAYLVANSLGSPTILAVLFFIAGVGRVASYFSAIFASRSQKKSGLATSVPLALSGLSPFILSYVAGLDVFQTPGGVFDVPKFVFWMGIGCTVIHAIGAIGLKHVDDLANEEGERARLMGASEDEHVIEAQREAMKAGCTVVQKVEPDGAVLALLKDCGFWGYVAIGIVITGTAETVIANIGTIVMEFPGHVESLAAAQVRFISIASTLAKLCTGPLADWICPPVDEGPTMVCWCGPLRPEPKKGLNRMLFPAICLAILASVYAYTAVYITSAEQLWVLSVGTGLAYGASWAVLPSITSVIWGARNLGRNFGILSYAPLIGTPIFTYIYAWASSGDRDWRTMFVISTASVVAALLWCMPDGPGMGVTLEWPTGRRRVVSLSPIHYVIKGQHVDHDIGAEASGIQVKISGLVNALEGLACGDFPHNQLAIYLAAILCLLIATLLGFLDDVFDIRWRHKLPIPLVAAIPLLLVYYAENGHTDVVVPIPLRRWFGGVIDLGPLYYLYMALLSTFTTNSINILAGMNGIEAGQALVIAVSVALNDLLYLPWSFRFKIGSLELGGVYGAGLSHGSELLVERHLLSLYFMLPLIGVCAGLLRYNWYPARVFPGDTFCYFTGMAFAVVGINGHFSKTLLLFFVPQVFNFVLSCPQLFGLVPCPRHRLPKIHPEQSQLLIPSVAEFEEGKPVSKLTQLVLHTLSLLGLVHLTYGPAQKHQSNGHSNPKKTPKRITSTTNLTLPNVLLCVFGPMSEPTLVKLVMGIQILGTVLAFCLRYGLAGLLYDGDRR
ncbi:tunicamycin resistance protein, partial [Ceratobasidium sp. 423]